MLIIGMNATSQDKITINIVSGKYHTKCFGGLIDCSKRWIAQEKDTARFRIYNFKCTGETDTLGETNTVSDLFITEKKMHEHELDKLNNLKRLEFKSISPESHISDLVDKFI